MKKQHMCILQRMSYMGVLAGTIKAERAATNQTKYRMDCLEQAYLTQAAYHAKRVQRFEERARELEALGHRR